MSADLWQHIRMIVAGTSPPIRIDLGKDEPGMTLQRQERELGMFVWLDVLKDCYSMAVLSIFTPEKRNQPPIKWAES